MANNLASGKSLPNERTVNFAHSGVLRAHCGSLPDTFPFMSFVSAQHELVGVLVNKYPRLILRLAEVAQIDLPSHDRAVPAPNDHQVRNRQPIRTDATVHLVRDGAARPGYFVQVEMQREYSFDKLTTLRAYHGSEVRNSGCGGQVLV